MASISTQEEYNVLKRRYWTAIKQASQWEDELENNFTEDEQMDIMSMIAYWENQEKGFGMHNDERHYADIHTDGRLLEEAKIGFEFAKACLQLGPGIRKWDMGHNKT